MLLFLIIQVNWLCKVIVFRVDFFFLFHCRKLFMYFFQMIRLKHAHSKKFSQSVQRKTVKCIILLHPEIMSLTLWSCYPFNLPDGQPCVCTWGAGPQSTSHLSTWSCKHFSTFARLPVSLFTSCSFCAMNLDTMWIGTKIFVVICWWA